MIYLYSGTPGSGKSLHTAQVLYWQLYKGLPAICNFGFAVERIKRKKKGQFVFLTNDDLTPGGLIYYTYCRRFVKRLLKRWLIIWGQPAGLPGCSFISSMAPSLLQSF